MTLLSTEPEIQFVALRNINLIVQKRLVFISEFLKLLLLQISIKLYFISLV